MKIVVGSYVISASALQHEYNVLRLHAIILRISLMTSKLGLHDIGKDWHYMIY